MRTQFSCVLALALAVPALLLAGCNSLYKPAAITVVTAETAMESFASYFDAAIVSPVQYGTTEAQLWAQRKTVDESWEKLRASLNLADDARNDYLAGVAEFGEVKAALMAARENSQALTSIITGLLPYQFQPK